LKTTFQKSNKKPAIYRRGLRKHETHSDPQNTTPHIPLIEVMVIVVLRVLLFITRLE
jgi:hypothetical protein